MGNNGIQRPLIIKKRDAQDNRGTGFRGHAQIHQPNFTAPGVGHDPAPPCRM
jgi:hypothetical protein